VDALLEGIKIQKTPKSYFDAGDEKRRDEMMNGSTNYFHSLQSPIIINIVRQQNGTLVYFFTAPAYERQKDTGVMAQFHRWDIFCEKLQLNFSNVFTSESTSGAIITFTPEQPFWDRVQYTRVQHPNFFKVLADAKTPLWIQIILVPTKPVKIQRPLAKLYKGEFRKFARKERRGKLNGALRNQYIVLSTRHQNWMNLAQEENLFSVTYRVAVPSTIDAWYLGKKARRLLNRKHSKNGQESLAMDRGEEDVIGFRRMVQDFASNLFIGIPGKAKVKYYHANDIWARFNSTKGVAHRPNQVILGRTEMEWVFPWPVHNFFGWELLADKVTDIEGQGRYFPLKENTFEGGIFLGYQATQASESAVTDLPLTRPLTTSLGIFGYPGTGKTNQVNNILQQLLARGENVLYLNGVKDEDHLALLAPDRARIWRPHTLGIDPFEYVPGIPAMRMVADFVEGFTYTKNLYVALENLMRVGLMKYAIYLGWGTTFDGLNQDNGGGRKFDLKKLPFIVQEELYRSKYAGETRANLQGATETRVRGFLYSPLGLVFTSNASVPVCAFTSGFNIVLLNKLQVDDQCFIAWVLLKKIYQYLTSVKEHGRKSTLTIVLEEAHVFLTQTKTNEESEYGKARAMLAEFLAMLIKEGREYGVRLIIVDQEPSDLIRSAIQPLAETLTFRVGKLDAVIFHQDPELVAAIDSLPNYFAIYKGKEVTHEVLLRPPKFEVPPQEQLPEGITQAKAHATDVLARWQGANPPTPPMSIMEKRLAGDNAPNQVGQDIKPEISLPLHIPPAVSSDKANTVGEERCEDGAGAIPPLQDDSAIPPPNAEDENHPAIATNRAPDQKPEDVQDVVFEYLVNCWSEKGVPLEQIETACNIPRPELLRVIRQLKDEGSVRETRSGNFAIA